MADSNNPTPPTALGETLQRRSDGWYWRDGTREPRVTDLNRNATYNFRVRAGRYVEVPRSRAENEPDLAWVVAALNRGTFQLSLSGDHTGPSVMTRTGLVRAAIHAEDDPLNGRGEPILDTPIPPVILVPTADWDVWVTTAPPLGVEWDKRHERDILDIARRLGYTP